MEHDLVNWLTNVFLFFWGRGVHGGEKKPFPQLTEFQNEVVERYMMWYQIDGVKNQAEDPDITWQAVIAASLNSTEAIVEAEMQAILSSLGFINHSVISIPGRGFEVINYADGTERVVDPEERDYLAMPSVLPLYRFLVKDHTILKVIPGLPQSCLEELPTRLLEVAVPRPIDPILIFHFRDGERRQELRLWPRGLEEKAVTYLYHRLLVDLKRWLVEWNEEAAPGERIRLVEEKQSQPPLLAVSPASAVAPVQDLVTHKPSGGRSPMSLATTETLIPLAQAMAEKALVTGFNNGLKPLIERQKTANELAIFINPHIDPMRKRTKSSPLVGRRADPAQMGVVINYTGAQGHQRAVVRSVDDSLSLAEVDQRVDAIYASWNPKGKFIYNRTPVYEEKAVSEIAGPTDPFLAEVDEYVVMANQAISDQQVDEAKDLVAELATLLRESHEERSLLAARLKKSEEQGIGLELFKDEADRKLSRLFEELKQHGELAGLLQEVLLGYLDALRHVESKVTDEELIHLGQRIRQALEPSEFQRLLDNYLTQERAQWQSLLDEQALIADDEALADQLGLEIEAAQNRVEALELVSQSFESIFGGRLTMSGRDFGWSLVSRDLETLEISTSFEMVKPVRAKSGRRRKIETLTETSQPAVGDVAERVEAVEPAPHEEVGESTVEGALEEVVTPVEPEPAAAEVVPATGSAAEETAPPPEPVAAVTEEIWLGAESKAQLEVLGAEGVLTSETVLKRRFTSAKKGTRGWSFEKLQTQRQQLLAAGVNVYSILKCLHQTLVKDRYVALKDFLLKQLGAEAKDWAEQLVASFFFGLKEDWGLPLNGKTFPGSKFNSELRDLMVEADRNWQDALTGVDVWAEMA